MEYLLLIYAEESKTPNCQDPEFPGIVKAYSAFTEEVTSRGILLGANPLQPVNTATTVRVRDEKSETTDGPFAETKEQLAGYYLLDCKELDEAIECASRIPGAKFGSIEIRPIMKIPEVGG